MDPDLIKLIWDKAGGPGLFLAAVVVVQLLRLKAKPKAESDVSPPGDTVQGATILGEIKLLMKQVEDLSKALADTQETLRKNQHAHQQQILERLKAYEEKRRA